MNGQTDDFQNNQFMLANEYQHRSSEFIDDSVFQQPRMPQLNFDINLEIIRQGQDARTSIMIKNIPNKYSQAMLLENIDRYHLN